MADFEEHLKREFAKKLVEWGFRIVLVLVTIVVCGGTLYYYRDAIKHAMFATITAPITSAKEKVSEIGAKAKETTGDVTDAVRGKIEAVREQAGTIKENLSETVAGAKEKAQGTLVDTKDRAAELAVQAKERSEAAAKAAAEKARNATDDLKDRWHRMRGKNPAEDGEEKTQE